MAPLRTLQHRFHAGFPVKNEVVMKKYLSIALLTGALLMSGCGDSENFVFTNNTNVAVAPVCVDDAYTTNQDTTLTRVDHTSSQGCPRCQSSAMITEREKMSHEAESEHTKNK